MNKALINDGGLSTIRGIAALAVVIAHSYQIFLARILGNDLLLAKVLTQMAHQAVLCFFIVSGVLITQSVLVNIGKYGRFSLVEYISARVARIYPPLLCAIGLSLLYYVLINHLTLPGADVAGGQPYGLEGDLYQARKTFSITATDIKQTLIMNNGLLQVNGPLWSLCIEWRIYVAVGAVAILATWKGPFLKIAGAILCFWAVSKLLRVNEFAYFYLLIWCTGAAATLCRHFAFQPFKGWVRRKVVGACILTILAVWATLAPELLFSGGVKFGAQENAFQFLICLFWLNTLLVKKEHPPAAWREKTMKLGDFSYSLYIVHFPTMLFLLSLLQNRIGGSLVHSVTAALLSIATSLCIAYCVAQIFEKRSRFKPLVDAGLKFPANALQRYFSRPSRDTLIK